MTGTPILGQWRYKKHLCHTKCQHLTWSYIYREEKWKILFTRCFIYKIHSKIPCSFLFLCRLRLHTDWLCDDGKRHICTLNTQTCLIISRHLLNKKPKWCIIYGQHTYIEDLRRAKWMIKSQNKLIYEFWNSHTRAHVVGSCEYVLAHSFVVHSIYECVCAYFFSSSHSFVFASSFHHFVRLHSIFFVFVDLLWNW